MTRPPTVDPAARDAILAWYATHGRTLAFRATTDPWAILVSEAMAQQTQAERAAAAWTAFMARFPTVEAVADAPPADILRAWQGLGYNRRALDLQRAARRIVDDFGGTVPSDLTALESLPGVGPYSARAVAAFAFGMPVGAVDTNVRRVLGRIAAGDDVSSSAVAMQRLANAAVPVDRPGEWTHALMDIGATLCRPREPRCGECPARPWCRYAAATHVRVVPDPAVVPRAAPAPFPTTSRWLRGRIVDRLRAAPNGCWVELDHEIGTHRRPAVETALRALANDGLVELDGDAAGLRVRLPVAPA